MSIEEQLRERSDSSCELCGEKQNLMVYTVPPGPDDADHSVLTCATCFEQLNNPEHLEPNHWRCLNTSMWSEVTAVKVVAWRVLNQLKSEGWPQDLLDMLYMEDDALAWAKANPLIEHETASEDQVIHKDSNGNVLQAGDTVVLIKDLDVKGAGFTAKRGTAVRGISLVEGNAGQIEGRVNGQQIVILTQYVKKSN